MCVDFELDGLEFSQGASDSGPCLLTGIFGHSLDKKGEGADVDMP